MNTRQSEYLHSFVEDMGAEKAVAIERIFPACPSERASKHTLEHGFTGWPDAWFDERNQAMEYENKITGVKL